MSSSSENLGPDPSMDEILSSIRRILKEDERSDPGMEAPNPVTPPAPQPMQAAQPHDDDPVLILDPSMMVPETAKPVASSSVSSPPPPPAPRMAAPVQPAIPAPPQPPDDLLGKSAAETASSHLGALMRTLPLDRGTAVSRGGPTLEDMVREELRPLLRAWLDANLPPLVERIVRTEIERLVARTNL